MKDLQTCGFVNMKDSYKQIVHKPEYQRAQLQIANDDDEDEDYNETQD